VWLVQKEFPVPDAWILPSDIFEDVLESLSERLDPKSLVRVGASKRGEARTAALREELDTVPFPASLEKDLEKFWIRHAQGWSDGLAVRSSATCEDGSLVSMAGLAESVLGVTSLQELRAAIRRVWSSAISGRALTYLAAHGVREISMAVVLQRLVNADSAGVMFTRASDVGGNKHERLINASFGLGLPVVDGRLTPDLFRVDHRGRSIETSIADKKFAVRSSRGRLTETKVEHPQKASLGPKALAEIAEVAIRLERVEDHGWDVEFAYEHEKLWVLQARPVTRSAFPHGGNEHTVWSNANVGEALPGVATPLTWSVAGEFSEAGFRRAFATLGCSVPKDVSLVSLVYGRIYLNISDFLGIANQVPWLETRALLEMAGCVDVEPYLPEYEHAHSKGFLVRLPITAARLFKEQLRLDRDIEHFEKLAEQTFRTHNALDLTILTDDAITKRIREAQELLERAGTVMLTCASSSLGLHLGLHTLLSKASPLGSERLAQSLTAGIHDLESARPAIGIARVAEVARKEPEALAVLLGDGPVGLDALPDGPTRRGLQSFLDVYGDRGVREAELSTPRWREDARPVIAMLRVALKGTQDSVDLRLGRVRSFADSEMQRVLGQLNLVEQTLLRHLVARAQKAARLRERMRAWVTRMLGLLRSIFLDADRRLLRLDPQLQAGSVFFLTVDEVVHALKTEQRDMKPMVSIRRAEHLRNLARPNPPRTFVGTPYTAMMPPEGGVLFRGTAASSGVVEGIVRVLTEATMAEFQPGEILVVHTTDVGWTPLFLSAAGVVSELGGPLSHASIVAREFGVPCVVNIQSATHLLRTGDRVRVDGDRGVVEKL
ncbi:MAG: phosphoenolpyruvate synthase, partial [Polyangiaceae bacterium]|nr:phosphoenolpyruvate synthase [Polyangiaceae bacterium]